MGYGYPLRSSKDERSIVHFLRDHAQPCMYFFVVHLELVRSDDSFASCVLDYSDDSLDSSYPFMVLGERGFELNGCELDVELRHNLDLRLCQIFPRFDNI